MKKLRIYLDTSVINFLYADDAPEKREATVQFFSRFVATGRYEVVISPLVLDEIGRTRDAAHRSRLLDKTREYALKMVSTEPHAEIMALADAYIEQSAIPDKKYDDALHVALCTVNEVDVLLSWNYAHLANVNKERRILAVNHAKGYFYPLRITTPLEVMDDE